MDIAFEGLIPAIVLPMDERGDIDEPALRHYAKWVADQGPTALAINVDTGETAHLSHSERLRVLEIVKEEVSVPCVAGIAGPSTRAAVEQARDFKAAGADAFLMFPIPAYLSTPLDPAIPLAYHRAVAEVGVPLIIFQLQPALAGVYYDETVIAQLASIDHVVAMKEASFDARRFMNAARILGELDSDVALLTGNDNFIFESFVLGATGALIGFGAIMTAEQVQMIEAWKKGQLEEARELGQRIQRLADAVFAPPVSQYRARLKECLVTVGVLERAHVREPLLPISSTERDHLRSVLAEVGLL